jgi:hypothetical protein
LSCAGIREYFLFGDSSAVRHKPKLRLHELAALMRPPASFKILTMFAAVIINAPAACFELTVKAGFAIYNTCIVGADNIRPIAEAAKPAARFLCE